MEKIDTLRIIELKTLRTYQTALISASLLSLALGYSLVGLLLKPEPLPICPVATHSGIVVVISAQDYTALRAQANATIDKLQDLKSATYLAPYKGN